MKKRTLTKEKVIHAAIDLANELGDVQALSLKLLAERLDIRTPSLYNHIKNQDDLIYWMTESISQQLLTAFHQAIRGKFGADALIAIAHAYRSTALANPGVYALFLHAPPDDQGPLDQVGIELINTTSLVLGGLGLQSETETIHAIRAFRSVLHGFVSLELNQGFQLELSRDESFSKLIDLFVAGLSL